MKKRVAVCLCILSSILFIFNSSAQEYPTDTTILTNEQITLLLSNAPNVEVGKGVSISSKDNRYKLTMRVRMQSMVGIDLTNDFSVSETEACVKRLHLRFDGHVFSPKVAYSIQLGYSPYDAKNVPNGNLNIIRDAMLYYIPSSSWSLGIGQTKLRANRANSTSSSALHFVDRSIVNSQFSIDRDFGIFGEFHNKIGKQFNYAIKAAITTGEGRNFHTSKKSGLAYTGRIELYPLGKFTSGGDVIEGDYINETTPKLMIAGSYSYNDRACRLQGEKGALLADENRRSLQSFFADLSFKYRGFAFYTDLMGRICNNSIVYQDDAPVQYIYTGMGVNIQASYIFPYKWELAVRHSSLLPDTKTQIHQGYKSQNQASLGISKYIIGHNLKIQADFSYNYATQATADFMNNERWQARLSVDVGI